MSPERWQYLKNLRPSKGRYIHISAPIITITGKDGLTHRVVGKGTTYRKGK